MADSMVPIPQSTIFEAVNRAIPNTEEAEAVMANPALAKHLQGGTLQNDEFTAVQTEQSDACGNGEANCTCGADGIAMKSLNEIGRATAEDVKEALHQVIDPELGIDVVDLGLVYGIEIDELGRAILTMTLTTPACPLTDLIEDECATTLAGLVDEFRIDWTWNPRWTVDKITPEGRDQLAAIGFNLDALPKY
ncbi:Iron-sulfur cluster assembly protein [Bifidobacterium dolichotidis]|uniref:Iron-sulfur cluster assembly protein n=1 Tax=Bifidobacterium dolichotidis TaxID=2306976 RepID=A0A430FSY0_9BIFI|nr:metal-sulfur cluster assembly factor [Bifidobacterium dolichotidis]RSX55965.1 Iron-sulfur cluster assembly protein [Bifidobacterium dolichotidis]